LYDTIDLIELNDNIFDSETFDIKDHPVGTTVLGGSKILSLEESNKTTKSPTLELAGIDIVDVVEVAEATKVNVFDNEENKLCIIDISSYSCSRNSKYIT
jgi:hypothetical protein